MEGMEAKKINLKNIPGYMVERLLEGVEEKIEDINIATFRLMTEAQLACSLSYIDWRTAKRRDQAK